MGEKGGILNTRQSNSGIVFSRSFCHIYTYTEDWMRRGTLLELACILYRQHPTFLRNNYYFLRTYCVQNIISFIFCNIPLEELFSPWIELRFKRLYNFPMVIHWEMLELGFKLRLDSAFTTMVGHLFLDINEEKDKEQPHKTYLFLCYLFLLKADTLMQKR